jgi:hypothetical protein
MMKTNTRQPVIVNPDGVDAFSMTLNNSAGTVNKNYRLFDADGLNDAVDGLTTYAAADSATVTVAALVATTVGHPIVCSGYNYETSSNVNQFAQQFKIKRASINGGQEVFPDILSKAKRNTQQNSLLLTISQQFVIDDQTCIDVTVLDSETVTLTFFVEGFLVR